MRTCLALVIALVGCGPKSATPTTPEPEPRGLAIEAPTVTATGVIATDDSPPPLVVLIDAKGQHSLAAAASWQAIATGTFVAGPKPGRDGTIAMFVADGAALHKDPKAVVDSYREAHVDRQPTGATDDPPPPEEDDESGGTGTAMALTEGKMGRKGADGPPRGTRWIDYQGEGALRQSTIVGQVTSDQMKNVPAVVIPHPSTKAVAVVKAVTDLQAMIGVRSGGGIRPLRIQFHRDRDNVGDVESEAWVEVRLDASGLTIEAVPSAPVTVAWADAAKIKAALTEARDRRKFATRAPVDVLVSPDVDAQHLVDVLVALDNAGVLAIGLGITPTGEQLALRGHQPARPPKEPVGAVRNVPAVSIGNPNAQGDLDKEIIRRYVKRNIQKIQYCYEKELLAKPGLRGTVQVQFFITPDGKVATASGTGVDPEVANCVAAVVKDIEFPKPKGGGGVQVNYPFTFKQDGDN